MTELLTFAYLALFNIAAVPAIVRVVERGSSDDLSLWREGMVIAGCVLQLIVMRRTGAKWQVIISPVVTISTLVLLVGVVLAYR